MEPKQDQIPFKLPLMLISDADLNRRLRELSALDDFFLKAAARKSGMPVQLPGLTKMLNQIAVDNSFNLLQPKHRQLLADELRKVQAIAPILHISFATEPSAKFLEQLLLWFRGQIHAYCLLQVGLQPAIAAGCVLRTSNKVFDMSLREGLDQQKGYLLELVKGAVNG